VPYQLLFNTTKAPSDNPKARQALSYATDRALLMQAAAPGIGVPTESTSGPGGLYFQPTVEGTMNYDLDKAKQLVQELGGLSFQLNYPTNSPIYLTAGQAAVSMWKQAGIEATLNPTDPATSGQNNRSGNWQIQFTTVGGYDPSAGQTGFANRYGSKGSLSGRANNPEFDDMAAKAASELDPDKRAEDITQIYEYIAKNALSINLFAVPCIAVGVKNLTGLDAVAISTAGKEMIHWDNVKFTD
jgi:peptide/nickel transport system substrate-binding protein